MNFASKSSPMEILARRRYGPAHAAHLHPAIVAKLNAYKEGLLEEFSNGSEALIRFARLAVNEAEGLAWSTSHAHLFLPALAEEKLHYARQWAGRQLRVGNGLTAVSSTTPHEVIRWNELISLHRRQNLASGRVSRSSETASPAFEAGRSDAQP